MTTGLSRELERSYWFDAEIRRQRFPNARKLAEHFEISSKAAAATIDRLRNDLHFPLEYVSEKRGYRYYDEAFELPPLWLQEPRASSLLLAYDLLRRLVSDTSDPASAAAVQRLYDLARIPETLRERLTFETIEHHPPANHTLMTVLHALTYGQTLELEYEGKVDETPTRRQVEPRLLHNFAGNWYLFAHCRLRGELRMFALDRMRRAELLDERFDFPEDFSPQQFAARAFGLFKTGPVQVARLKFSPFISAWVRDQIWHRDQTMSQEPDGSVELCLPYAGDGLDLVREVMKFGPEVEVIEPECLRQAVLVRLQETLGRYEGTLAQDLPPETG